MKQESPDQISVGEYGNTPTARLRILETTDLHMQLLDYDYFADRTDETIGLIRLLGQITQHRTAPNQTCLLFDNGDFIQGNPLGDYLANNADRDAIHPMIAAFNTLQYDAIALGNHEFNYGLPFLRQALKDAQFPVTCANISQQQGPPLAEKFVILERTLPCSDGQTRALKIGVMGFVTPQITQWDSTALDGALTTEDIVICAIRTVPEIKAAGADVVIALCHSGIGRANYEMGMENAAVPLATVGGIDVILTGHTHEIFPDASRPMTDVVNPTAGTLHGKPAVMAGFYGNRLGVIDLELCWHHGGWRIESHSVSLEQGTADTPAAQPIRDKITADVSAAHNATLAHIRQPIAVTSVPIHSYFGTIGPDLSQQLLADAQFHHITKALQDSVFQDLPVISATAPFRVGGKAGPGHYIDVAPGPLTLRDAAAIYPFANTLSATRRKGADLRAWLERSASHFSQIKQGTQNQPIINPRSPAYHFDTLFGLYYEIDLSQPARYDTEGVLRNPNAARIRSLTLNGKPVRDDDPFVLATNSYRANGGGNFQIKPNGDAIHCSTQSTLDILIAHLRFKGTVSKAAQPTWAFAHLSDTRAVFYAAPAARQHMTSAMRHIGPGCDGFDQYQLIF